MTNLLQINNLKDFIVYLTDMSGNERMKATIACGIPVRWRCNIYGGAPADTLALQRLSHCRN